MACSKTFAFIAIVVVLLPLSTKGFDDDHDRDHDDLAPAVASFLKNVCDDVQCGKGRCVANVKYPLGFKCECDRGWSRTRHHDDHDDDDRHHDDHDDDLGFLPCVIPNCTMNYSCQPAPPPVPEKEAPFNKSFFDPCYWTYCGEGTCIKNSTHKHSHRCECKSGFYNLMNASYFPCYSDCTIGSDCSSLGIKVSNAQSGGSSATMGDDRNQATSFLPGRFHWLAIFMGMGLAMWH